MRWLSAVVALVLLPSIAPDLLELACPHHLGHGHAAGHRGHHEAQSEGHSSHAGHHHEPGGHAASDDHRAAPDDGRKSRDDPVPPPCTCVGSCPTSVGPAAPSGPAAVAPSLRPHASARTASAADRAPSRRAPYTLPFANAPPLA